MVSNLQLDAMEEEIACGKEVNADACGEQFLEFDDIIPYVGGCGSYQRRLFSLLWVSVILTSFPAFNQVFMVASPNHWCRVPEMQNSSLSTEEIKNFTLPVEKRNEKTEFSQCLMYDVEFLQVIDELVANGKPIVSNSSWPVTTCKFGWEFDSTWYGKTTVTEVIFLFIS